MGKLVAVHLHGPLGERYGTPHHFAVQSPREALYALDANFPGFIASFVEHERYGIVVDDDWREGENAAVLPASKDIHFVPVVEGETPLVALGLTTVFTGLSMTAATIIGSLLVTGLMIGISLLFRPKKPEKPEAQEKDESFIFSGPENVTGQGVAVPLIYGRVFAGSVVVSAGQDTVDVAITTAKKGNSKPAAASTAKPGGYSPPVYRGGAGGFRSITARTGMSAAKMMEAPQAKTMAAPVTTLVTPLASRQYALRGLYISDEGVRSYATAAGYVVEQIGKFPYTEEAYETWPDLINEGAGTDHLRDPPVDGWPAIIEDPTYTFKPEGWIPVKAIWVTDDDDGNRKQVMVWQPDYETVDYVYNWNMVRGFYVTEVPVVSEGVPGVVVAMEAEEEEWIAGEEAEIPIEEPSQ